MKDQKINLNEKEFLDVFEEFFRLKTIMEHLSFVDQWVDLLLGGKMRKKWRKPGHLYFYHQQLTKLFESCNALLDNSIALESITSRSTISITNMALEKQNLIYFPYQLKRKELLSPIKVIKQLFKNRDCSAHCSVLNDWLAEGLNNNYNLDNSDYISPLYGHLKKLIAACWLIHERLISKNSFKNTLPANALHSFALTEPFLFDEEEASDPFGMIELFFDYTNLSGYRNALQKYYLAAISEEATDQNPNALYFLHNQYNMLIQAGYLIVKKGFKYVAVPNKTTGKTFGEQLLNTTNRQVKFGELNFSDEAPHVLSMAERADPMAYCATTLNYENVAKLRLGLKEWLIASLSIEASIEELGIEYGYQLYLTLQKLTEAFYLIITANATADECL